MPTAGAGVRLEPRGELSPLGQKQAETTELHRHTQRLANSSPCSSSLIVSCHSSSLVQKQRQTRHIAALLQLSARGYVCLEHLYPSLAPSLTDYVTALDAATNSFRFRFPTRFLYNGPLM